MGRGVTFISEHLPVFRALCEGGLGPHKNGDSVHAKSCIGRGQTDKQTDIATTTTSKNWPKG